MTCLNNWRLIGRKAEIPGRFGFTALIKNFVAVNHSAFSIREKKKVFPNKRRVSRGLVSVYGTNDIGMNCCC